MPPSDDKQYPMSGTTNTVGIDHHIQFTMAL